MFWCFLVAPQAGSYNCKKKNDATDKHMLQDKVSNDGK